MSARDDALEVILNELAWQGALQISLKAHQSSIDVFTIDLLWNPAKVTVHGPAGNNAGAGWWRRQASMASRRYGRMERPC